MSYTEHNGRRCNDREFLSVKSGWDIKHMVRLIVTSRCYRQSSKVRPDLLTRDPYNRLYARQSPIRLDAEFVRDVARNL